MKIEFIDADAKVETVLKSIYEAIIELFLLIIIKIVTFL